MPEVTITRKNNSLPSKTRSTVRPGEIFQYVDGKSKSKELACIGKNGRFYSVNLETKQLASSAKGDRNVAVIGKFSYALTLVNPADGVVKLRRDVKSGEVFKHTGTAKDGTPFVELYTNMGAVDKSRNGFLSMHLNGVMNHAIAEKGDSEVLVLGEAKLVAVIAR